MEQYHIFLNAPRCSGTTAGAFERSKHGAIFGALGFSFWSLLVVVLAAVLLPPHSSSVVTIFILYSDRSSLERWYFHGVPGWCTWGTSTRGHRSRFYAAVVVKMFQATATALSPGQWRPMIAITHFLAIKSSLLVADKPGLASLYDGMEASSTGPMRWLGGNDIAFFSGRKRKGIGLMYHELMTSGPTGATQGEECGL